MAGDSSDNIPGIPGVGTRPPCACCKSTAPWKTPWPTRRREKGKLGEKLQTYADQARSCKELARIHRDAPVELHLEECTLDGLKQGVPALEKLQLRKVAAMIAGKDRPPLGPRRRRFPPPPPPRANRAGAPTGGG